MMGKTTLQGRPPTTIRDLEQQASKDKEALDKLVLTRPEAAVEDEGPSRDLEQRTNRQGDREGGINNLLLTSAARRTRWKSNSPRPTNPSWRASSKTEEMLEREKARLGQVLTVAEIDESNQAAQSELAARDDWYVQHMQLFED